MESSLTRVGLLKKRKAMINRDHALPINRQAELACTSRGAVYCLPRPVSEADQRLMRRIDELHLAHRFAGARMLRDLLGRGGVKVGRVNTGTHFLNSAGVNFPTP